MIDLGHWLNGDYALPDERKELTEEEAALLEKDAKSSTVH